MVDGHREDLREQVDVHVDRARRQGPRAAEVAAAEAIDIGDHSRLPALEFFATAPGRRVVAPVRGYSPVCASTRPVLTAALSAA